MLTAIPVEYKGGAGNSPAGIEAERAIAVSIGNETW